MRIFFVTLVGLAILAALVLYVKPIRDRADRVIFNDAQTLREGVKMETPISDAAAAAREKISQAVGNAAAAVEEP